MDGRQPPADEGVRQVPAQRPSLAANGRARRGPVTFLFADIRGYTRFTASQGAEAAARLADTFVTLSQEVVNDHGGAVRGSWGDQILAEFDSPRDGVRAAIEFQGRCIVATLRDPSTPLGVGVGLDVGEPADEGDNQSAAALNVAARLCARAGPGEVLASAELVHLAGAVDDVSYVPKGTVRFKGVDGPTNVVLVRGTRLDPDRSRQFRDALGPGRNRHRERVGIAAALVVALVAAVAAVTAVRGGQHDAAVTAAGGVAVVDSGSGRVVDAVDMGGSPEGTAVGAGDLWVTQAASNAVVRVDLATRQLVQTIPVGRVPVAVAVTGRDAWVVNSQDGTVSRISTTTNRVLDSIPVGNQPVAIAEGKGYLWVANSYDATVSRIDSRSGKPMGTAQVGRGPAGIALGAGKVWVTNSRDNTVSPVDPRTLEAGAPIPVGTGPKGVTVAPSGVWVANRLDLTVTHIDPATRRELATIAVGDSPFAVAAGVGKVWVSASAAGTLVELDPDSNRVSRTLRVGASPYGIALAGGKVWSVTRPFASAEHVGGTLRVAGVPTGIDPGFDLEWPMQFMVYDGLVAYRRAGGVDSYDPVPDLAVALPEPTDGGRTYTFEVRAGVRYSDGRPVEPADFRRGLERTLTAGRGARGSTYVGYYKDIIGAQECLRPKTTCDLGKGIQTGESTVTFRLLRRDPDFVYKLALPLAAPVPPGTPAVADTAEPVLGTGPYKIADFVPTESLRLERNEEFRSWSAAAQPVGYPDAIQWRAVPPRQLAKDVGAGHVDVADLQQVSRAVAADVALRIPERVHEDPVLLTAYVALDTSRPPFDRVDARRAVALAVDRARIAAAWRVSPEYVTCGLLPPQFPGYETYCPWTDDPDESGTWHGPDVPRARQMVARSGTVGDRVDVWWSNHDAAFTAVGRYVVRMLRDLGYRARLHTRSGFVEGTERPPPHVTQYGWLPDYPSPSAYFRGLLDCRSLSKGENVSRHCDPELDALVDRAERLAESDPGEANRLWRRVFRAVTDRAIIVPTHNYTQSIVVSERIGNFQAGTVLGPLLDQMWVR